MYIKIQKIYRMYIESRKVVLMNLLPRHKQKLRHRERNYGRSGGSSGQGKLRLQLWNTLPCSKASGKLLDNTESSPGCSVMTQRGGIGGGIGEGVKDEGVGCRVRGREAQEGGNMCILTADSHCCTAETNTTL